MKQPENEQCATCSQWEYDAYICNRWRLAYAVNELKKAVPLLRGLAVEDMQCPYRWPEEETLGGHRGG